MPHPHHHFDYRQGLLHAEGVSLERIARAVGTPTYVYSAGAVRRHYHVVDKVFGSQPHLICYSVKANSNLALLTLLAQEGSGFDIVSGGELYRALEAGADPKQIIYSGVGKTEAEIAYALETGILAFNAENEEELDVLARVARRRRMTAPVSLRVNPGIDPGTHRHIATGVKTSKFGIPFSRAARLYRAYRQQKGISLVGIDFHLGSQLTDLEPIRKAVAQAATLYRTLLGEGLPLRYLDVGGGLGITYRKEQPPSPQAWAQTIIDAAKGLPATIIVEPGRVLVGNAGVLLTRVLYTKKGEEKRFLVVDAAMNDLMRPALYEAHHQVVPVRRRAGRQMEFDVVGPICESTDVLARERKLPALNAGELLSIMSAGAYGMSMASNYNSRPRPAEVLIEGPRFEVVRQRETYADLVRGEQAFSSASRRRLAVR